MLCFRQKGKYYQDITLKCEEINYLLEKHNIHYIDYCSIDTEGAEYKIIKSINFDKINKWLFR